MMYSTVLDPETVQADTFDWESMRGIEHLFEALDENLLLVVDPNRDLMRQLLLKVRQLRNPAQRQRIQMMIERAERWPNRKRSHIITCDPTSFVVAPRTDASPLSRRVHECSSTDTLISQTVGDANLPLGSYPESEFEHERKKFRSCSPCFDSLTYEEVCALFRRVFRYAKRIRFYDPYFFAYGDAWNWERTLVYLLQVWSGVRHFTNPDFTEVEIYTQTKAERNLDIDRYVKYAEKHMKKVVTQCPEFTLRLIIKAGDSSSRIAHERFLESNCLLFGVDPGFDFYKKYSDCRAFCSVTLKCLYPPHSGEKTERVRRLPTLREISVPRRK